MKCTEFEKMVLLRQTGELSASDDSALLMHIESCPACAEYDKSLARLCADSRKSLLDKEPSMEAVAYVLNKGRELEGLKMFMLVRNPAVQWLALAASMVIVAGTCLMLTPFNEVQPVVVTTVHSNGSAVFDLASIATYDAEAEQVDTVNQPKDTGALADKLLEIEGFANGGSSEDDLFTLFGEPSTTDPLSRNSLVSPSRICV